MEAAAKREKEKQVIQEMISLYCRKQHHGQSLCKECQTLCRYAHQRIDCCPFMESKTFCSNCTDRSWSFSICGCHERRDIHETCLFYHRYRIYAAGSRRCCASCSAYDTVSASFRLVLCEKLPALSLLVYLNSTL